MKMISELVKEVFGNSIEITSSRSCGGGCINQTQIIDLSNGNKLFLKSNSSRYREMFSREAEGLKLLFSAEGPRVPEVYAVRETHSNQYLLLEFISSSSRENNSFFNFGRSLAGLHKKSNSRFGLDSDNFIGSSVQVNSWKSSWTDFFAGNRLLYQLELAFNNNLATSGLKTDIENIIRKIKDILPEPDQPSLLHGDLWSGNFITDESGNAVLIDPAVYYGHYEADLAMTELFGGFDKDFYSGYNEINRIENSYKKRKDLYNLYHMLNHLNLFGRSYLSSCESIAAAYA